MDMWALIFSGGALIISAVALWVSLRATRAHESNAETNEKRFSAEEKQRRSAELSVTQEAIFRKWGTYTWVFTVMNHGPASATDLRFSYTIDGKTSDSPRSFSIDPGDQIDFTVEGPSEWAGNDVTYSLSWSDGRGPDRVKEMTTPLFRPPA